MESSVLGGQDVFLKSVLNTPQDVFKKGLVVALSVMV